VQRLHNHSFYLFSVVVGLSIREALVRTTPSLFLPSKLETRQVHLEALRLIVFLTAIACFYFGSGVFFNKVYLDTVTAENYKKKIYGIDYGFGFIHFLFFFVWAVTINDFTRSDKFSISPFLSFLSVIFLYDLVWLLASRGYDTFDEIKTWAVWSVAVFLAASVVFFVFIFLNPADGVQGEEAAFVVYFLYLIGDLIELFSGKPFFVKLIKALLPKGA
jgi:hypothetical protein